jgi:transcriptional regulator with XRE-family HTH domain
MTEPYVGTHEALVAKLEKDPEFRKADRLIKPYYDLLLEVIRRRKGLGITQKELAERAGTHQSCISRVESAEHDVRLSTIIQIAEALETRLEIRLVPIYYIEDKAYRELLRVESVPSGGGSVLYDTVPEDAAPGRTLIVPPLREREGTRPS